jgi:hypothetical protein
MWEPKLGIPNSFPNSIVGSEYATHFGQYFSGEGLAFNVYSDITFDEDDVIKIDDMGFIVHYVIRYFDAKTLIPLGTTHLTSGASGKLKLLDFPALTLNRPIVVYSIDRQDFDGMSDLSVNSTSFALDRLSNNKADLEMNNLNIANQATNKFIQNSSSDWRVVKVMNCIGQEIILSTTEDGLSANNLANGMYLFVVSNGREFKTIKFICANE